MIRTTTESITCTDAFKCHKTQLKKIETKLSLKLHKDNPSDPLPDGSVSILHTQNTHKIMVEIYD